MLRRLARFRARFVPAFLLIPAAVVIAFDLARRWQRLVLFSGTDRLRYGFSMLESAALWGALLILAAGRRGTSRWLWAAAFVLLGPLAFGTERYFYNQFETYLNADAAVFGAAFPKSLRGQIAADALGLSWAVGVPLLLCVVLVAVARRWVRPARRLSRMAKIMAPACLVAALCVPCSFRTVQAATPDLIFFHALGTLAQHFALGRPQHVEPGFRRPPFLPVLSPAPRPPRNVLFILTESVRFDAVCAEHDPECRRSPFTENAVPERMPLLQMRSNSSTTAISFGVLLSGLPPTETRDAIHDAPLLFDYAHAAGYDSAYWTSQHLMFAHSEEFVRDLPVSFRCGATDLDPDAHIDMGAPDHLLTERALRELPQLREPWFAMVHYAGTHFPYRIVEGDEPFQPASSSKAPDDNAELFNYYQNAVYAQDRTIADLIRSLRSTPAGSRTVIVYTSDHGEAFREHGQLGHTGAVLEEEIHVPAWLDAPDDALTPSERASLLAAKQEPTWHLDVAPTLLDLLGLAGAPEIARFRSKMMGTSLLGPERTTSIVPLTNCTELWGCAFRNWGLMRGALKLEAREWDFDWHCWDIIADPHERHDRGAPACGDLVEAAQRLFGGLPRNVSESQGPLTRE